MKRSRAIRFACWLGLTLAFGCEQIAGLGGDYALGGASAAGSGGRSVATGGATAGTGAGSRAEAGATDDEAGAAGAAGAAGDSSTAVAGSAGAAQGGTAGAPVGLGGSGGLGFAGAAGSAALGPWRVGFSEFHDSASGSDQASSHLADASFAKPAGMAVGDLMLVFFGSDHELSGLSGSDLMGENWKLIDQHQNYGTDGQATYLLYKLASGAEPDPIVFPGINSVPSGNGVQGLLSVYRGVNPLAPINDYQVAVFPSGATGVTEATTTTPALTTTVANCLLIAGLSPDTVVDAPVITAWPQGFVDNQVSVNNPAHPYPYGWANIYSAERHLAVAGAVPASSFVWSIQNGAQYFGSLAFVLALAP